MRYLTRRRRHPRGGDRRRSRVHAEGLRRSACRRRCPPRQPRGASAPVAAGAYASRCRRSRPPARDHGHGHRRRRPPRGGSRADLPARLPARETARARGRRHRVAALGNPGSIEGDGVLGCRRFGAQRVDCALAAAGRRCQVTATISFAAGRLRWGTYGCGYASRPRYRRRPRPLRRGDWSCEDIDTSLPAAAVRAAEARGAARPASRRPRACRSARPRAGGRARRSGATRACRRRPSRRSPCRRRCACRPATAPGRR